MATDLERLVVQLSADIKQYENAMNKAMGVTNKRARAIESRFAKMNKNISSSFQSSLSASVATIGGALGVAEIAKYADAWTEAGNKVNAAAASAGVQARSLEEITTGANSARAALGDYADLYARLIRSASNVAQNEQQIADATNIVAKAFKAGGAGASEQAAGILQLGQALGSGVLQGDELRSLLENAPILADAIAKEFKTTIAGLKQLGADGKLTSDRVFKAILAAQGPIEAQFAATNATIGDSFIQLRNNLTQYIGQTSEAYGVTATINGVLSALAGNISSVANAAAAAGAVLLASFGRGAAIASIGALANPFVALAAAVGAAAFAVTQLWDEIVPLQGSFATLGDYAGAMWEVLSDGAAATSSFIADQFQELTDRLGAALGSVGVTFGDVGNAIKFFINTTIESFVRWKDIIVATFTLVPAAIGDAVVSAMNAMISGVETAINKVVAAVNVAVEAINSLSGIAGISAIGTVDSVSIDRIANEYAGAGAKAAAAFNDALTRPSADYVGAAGDAITSTVDKAVTAITAKANDIAAARQELERESSRGNNFGGIVSGATNTGGFGGGVTSVGSGSSSGSKGKKSRVNDYDREIQQIKERTAALQAESAAQAGVNPLVNDYGYAVEYARAKQELLTAAQQAGIAVTPELEVNIDMLARAYGNAVVESEKLAESQDRIRQAAEDFKGTAKDVTSGFISDLRSGKTAAEALAGALEKVADKLLDMALNSIFGTGGSGGFGVFGGLFKAIGFAGGGYTGAGDRNDPAGIVHKGEYVVPKHVVDKIGVGNIEKMMRGYADGGLVGLKAPRLPDLSQVAPRGTVVNATYAPVIDNRGASVEAVARMEQALAQDRRNFRANVVSAVRQANVERVKFGKFN